MKVPGSPNDPPLLDVPHCTAQTIGLHNQAACTRGVKPGVAKALKRDILISDVADSLPCSVRTPGLHHLMGLLQWKGLGPLDIC